MLEDKGWLWEHYTKEENTNLIRCNNCERVFSNSNRREDLIYHLYDDHNKKEVDEHPERDTILQNFKISKVSLLATCNHCTRIINCAIQGVHVLTYHLKCIHWDKCDLKTTKRKPNLFRNYYTKNGKQTCKKCNKQIKLTNLRRHANIDCPRRVKQENLSIRNKFVIKNDEATCKGCEKTIKINKINLIEYLKRHLRHCPNKKKQKIHLIWDQYERIEDNKLKCKKCQTTMKAVLQVLRRHADIYCLRRVEREQVKLSIRNKFVIKENEATCKGCEKTIKINKIYPLILYLKSHLRHCINEGKQEIDSILDQYECIEDNKAKCKKCEKIVKAVAHHLRLHANSECHRRVEREQVKLSIRNKFVIKENEATCKGCEKTIKINKINLIRHLKHHLYQCLTEEKQEIHSIWDQYELTEDYNAKCKKCESIVKSVAHHLRLHANFYCLRRVKREQVNLSVRNKFVINENEATCKGCEKTIKINKIYLTSYLKSHLRHCPETKNIHLIWDQYERTEDNKAKCKKCERILKAVAYNLRLHANSDCLRRMKREQENLSIRNKFVINENKATCKGCQNTIKLQKNSNCLIPYLKKHLCYCFNEEKQKMQLIWDQYERIEDNKAKCKKCKRIVKAQNYTLRTHANFDCLQRMKVEQVNLSIRNKFVIKENEATCKGCEKTIKINKINLTSYLKSHLRHCRNEKIQEIHSNTHTGSSM